MPIWPFKKRRRSAVKDSASQPLVDPEKAQPEQMAETATFPSPARAAGPTPPIPIPRRSSKRGTQRRRRTSHDEAEKQLETDDKVDDPPAYMAKSEDITALPMSRKLRHSPHLRPIDSSRPHIPYNFHSPSQTDVPQQEGVTPPRRPNTLKKRPSARDSSSPQRMRSSRKRRDDDHVREEEIRAMSAQMPLPKRPGGFNEGPLRRESKKIRSLGTKETEISLPKEDSIHESMSGVVEQRGWVIGTIDVFNPRPAVRLSGTPQYVTPGSIASLIASSPEPLTRDKEKMPMARDSARKRDTIGSRADDLDASDLRMVMERDAKRREKRKKEQQEKLDRKLQNRNGRNRSHSDKKAREAEEVRRAEEAKQRAEEERRGRDLMTPPTDIHPAFRGDHEESSAAVGLGIGTAAAAAAGAGAGAATAGAIATEHDKDREMETAEQSIEDPFADHGPHAEPESEPERFATPASERHLGTSTPIESPTEEPFLGTARAVRMSQTSTPPLSPIPSNTRVGSSLSQVENTRQLPSPPPMNPARRASQPVPERRTGTWASFFRRGTTNKKPDYVIPAASEASFSNTSRESMRNQPLPPHLVDTTTQVQSTSQVRRKSGTPVRTQSKFREDLPELPISPPDSRMASPDITAGAATVATDRRAQRATQPIDVPRQGSATGSEATGPGRNDTPVSPSLRMMPSSLASVDSEGEWLASGSAKRYSTQSGGFGRRRESTRSYEELGEDKDAEHFSRATPSPENRRGVQERKKGASALAGAEEEEEAEFYDAQQDIESAADPPTVHGSVRRRPKLVQRDPRIRSREGLLAEYSGEAEGAEGEAEPMSATTGKGSIDIDSELDTAELDTTEPELHRATSVGYGGNGKGYGHARQISAGSAKLFDISSRRQSQGGDPSASAAKL